MAGLAQASRRIPWPLVKIPRVFFLKAKVDSVFVQAAREWFPLRGDLRSASIIMAGVDEDDPLGVEAQVAGGVLVVGCERVLSDERAEF